MFNEEVSGSERLLGILIGVFVFVCIFAQIGISKDNTMLITANLIDVNTTEVMQNPVTYSYNGNEHTEYRYKYNYYDVIYEYWYNGDMYQYKLHTMTVPDDTIELYINPSNPKDAIMRDSKVSFEELIRN